MRYKITIEYDGLNYCGWQKQKYDKNSIQESIEDAIKSITNEKVEVFGCGRTDAKVHALNMVAHFDLNKDIETYKLISGINYYLKHQYFLKHNITEQDITILSCEKVSKNFHARFSTKNRYYKYIILNRDSPTAIYRNKCWQIYKKLNFSKMKKCLKFLIGKKDWSSFRDSECQAKSPIKTINQVKLKKKEDFIIFEISAKSFLHHMIRNIIGTLINVGLNKISINDFEEIIKLKDRTKAGITAPPYGLYFVKADY